MNCTEARSAILRCDLAELAPQATGELAQHIARCGDCRVRADMLIASTATLRSAVGARGRFDVGHTVTHRRIIGALTVAAGIVAVAALALRTPRSSTPIVSRATQDRLPITIENAQGRAVTVVEGRDTINVIFHVPETQ